MQLGAVRPPVGLTTAGQVTVDGYVPLRVDPDLKCRPACLTTVIGNPDPPFEIRLHDDLVEISFEYMDVRRRIPKDAYLSGDVLDNSGYLNVTVSPERLQVDYIRSYLPEDESAERLHGEVAYTYTIP